MSTKIRIATFNIGDFSGVGFEKGSEEAKNAIRKTMLSVGAELWALQEDAEFFGDISGVSPYDAIYSDFANYKRNYMGRYNGKAFLSNHDLRDVSEIRYVGDKKFRHPWYLMGYVTLGGKEVCIINLHFDWSDKDVRAEQITQILTAVAKNKYCIVFGDFNPEDYANDGQRLSSKLLYEDEYARFKNAGLSLANHGVFGTFDTILDTKISPCPFDNIIVTPNIKLTAAGRVADEWMIDHALVWADIVIE